MALVEMLVTDFAISHTIQNQLNPGQVTSFCLLFVHIYWIYMFVYVCLYGLNVPKCVYESILRIRPVELRFLCPQDGRQANMPKLISIAMQSLWATDSPVFSPFPQLNAFSIFRQRQNFPFFSAWFSLLFVYHYSHGQQQLIASWSVG